MPVVVALALLTACAGGGGAPADADPPGTVRPAAGAASEAPLVGEDDLPGSGWRRLPPGVSPPAGSPPAGSPSADEWRWVARDCPWVEPADHPAREHRQLVRRDAYRQSGGAVVTVVVERFAAEWAAGSLASLRAIVRDCSRYETGDFMESHTVTQEGFAGDESLLIESVRTTPPAGSEVRRCAVVRRGDAVLTVIGEGVDTDALITVATATSHHL